ncbi:MAG TPA: carboxy terminal-processing peptidase [Ignavibacteriaceae bacterium]|nr:carboxy terminal-processing peptidase [Ignavibacteriaceae bacterium]
MKKLLIAAIVIIAANFLIIRSSQIFTHEKGSSDTSKVVQAEEIFSQENQIINTILSRYHYNKFQLGDSLSSVIFDRYIKSLDPSRSYFLKSDIDEFEAFRYKIDDFLKLGELNPAFTIFNRFKERLNERIDFVQNILTEEFDFTKDEYYQIDREDADWLISANDANEIWRLRVKNDALNLKIAGKEWSAIQETLKKRYESYRKAVVQYNSEDVFQLYMNSYTEALDPHTNYFSPMTSENFNIDMSLSVEGIGAQLQNEDEYVKIAEIIPGGPAAKSGLLFADDKIVGVAQGIDGEMIDIIGWRVNDAVKLIRGEKGTTVRLSILSASDGVNALPKEITLVREKVKLEEQAAKKSMLELLKDGKPYRIGVITIPKFYSDFEAQQRGEKDYKSTTRDVKKILAELKEEKVDGVIIDLRNDGGGSLNEAIDLTGLFIKDGPVVQVKNSDGSIEVGEDPDPNIVYDGPLAVIVNRFSASASEIFAGAIQDYGRGLILGEQTYGKGTVQNLIDLNRLMPSSKDKLGQVKLTIGKYYRITGGSTQNLGVIPDILFPSAFDAHEFGESSEPSALPWDQIKSSQYQMFGDLKMNLSKLKSLHEDRIKTDPEFDFLLEDIQLYKDSKSKKIISLKETIRRQEKEESDERSFQRENERRKLKGLTLLKKGEVDTTQKEKESDPVLNESGNILVDLISLSIG